MPPIFFDIRLKRSGRADGFRSDAFEQLLPKGRYHWFPGLGNQRIATHGNGVKIADPFAAKILIEKALSHSRENRRIIFFCACEFPGRCHRRTVAGLLLDEAARIGRRIQVVEWLGGSPRHMTLRVDDSVIAKVTHRSSVPLGNQKLDYVGLPWGSIVHLESPSKSLHVVAGPARFRDEWSLPFFSRCDSMSGKDSLLARAEEFRHRNGLVSSESVLGTEKAVVHPKALTIKQPWAHAIVHLGKDVENRSWRSNYRGPLLIHASKQPDKDSLADYPSRPRRKPSWIDCLRAP